jgi:hypothetical protein
MTMKRRERRTIGSGMSMKEWRWKQMQKRREK